MFYTNRLDLIITCGTPLVPLVVAILLGYGQCTVHLVAHYGDDVNIACSVPNPEDIYWLYIEPPGQVRVTLFRNRWGEIVQAGSHEKYVLWQNFSVVTVKNVTGRDDGAFACYFYSNDYVLSSNATLVTVYKFPSSAGIRLVRDRDVIAGEDIDVACIAQQVYCSYDYIDAFYFELTSGDDVIANATVTPKDSRYRLADDTHVFRIEARREFSSAAGRLRCHVYISQPSVYNVSSAGLEMNVTGCGARISTDRNSSEPRTVGDRVQFSCYSQCHRKPVKLFKNPNSPEVVRDPSLALGKEHDGVGFFCDVIDVPDARSDIVTFIIYRPPDVVIVSSCGNEVAENSDCRLTCTTPGGNLQAHAFEWRFKHKHGSHFRQPNGITNMAGLMLEAISYNDTGTYRCTATNLLGTSHGKFLLDIRYAPTVISVANAEATSSNRDRFVMYGSEGDELNFTLTLRSYPTPAVFSLPLNMIVDSSEQYGNDVTVVTIVAAVTDLTEHVITARNGVNGTATKDFGIVFAEVERPAYWTTPVDIRAVSVSYREVVVALFPGLSGGQQRTIRIRYKRQNESRYEWYQESLYLPVYAQNTEFSITSGLRSNTTYLIIAYPYLWRQLLWEDATPITTRERPQMTSSDANFASECEKLLLSWRLPPVYFSSVIIQQCRDNDASTSCLEYDVTPVASSRLDGSLTVHSSDGALLWLVVYQDRDAVVRLPFTERKQSTAECDDDENNDGDFRTAFYFVLGAFIFLAFVLLLVVCKGMNQAKTLKTMKRERARRHTTRETCSGNVNPTAAEPPPPYTDLQDSRL